MQGTGQAHFPQGIVVFVKGHPVQTHRNTTPRLKHGLDRSDARLQEQVRAGIDRNRHSAGSQHF
jgi:hypothetical protein